MKILSIDVGINNMGVVYASFSEDTIQVLFSNNININELECVGRNLSDKCAEFEKIIGDYISNASIILIEKQPPLNGGTQAIQELLYRQYRPKVKLISPNSMLRYFDILQFNYDERKRKTVEIASEYITFDERLRNHDIADAMCYIIYYIKSGLIDSEIHTLFEKSKYNKSNPFERFLFKK